MTQALADLWLDTSLVSPSVSILSEISHSGQENTSKKNTVSLLESLQFFSFLNILYIFNIFLFFFDEFFNALCVRFATS